MDRAFKKKERLHSKKAIERLFKRGATFVLPPVRTIWLSTEPMGESSVQVLIVVPKRNIAKAVQRNLVKRRMREAYRGHKQGLYEQLARVGKALDVAFVYTANEAAAYRDIEEKIILSLQRLADMNEVAAD